MYSRVPKAAEGSLKELQEVAWKMCIAWVHTLQLGALELCPQEGPQPSHTHLDTHPVPPQGSVHVQTVKQHVRCLLQLHACPNFSSLSLPAGKESKHRSTTSSDSPYLPCSRMLAQFPSAVMTLISQQSSSWGTRGAQGAPWICPYREVVQRFSDMNGCLGQGQNPHLPSEPHLQFKRRQIADVKPEKNSTIDRSIINRHDGFWMIFKESNPFFIYIVSLLRMLPASALVLTTQSHHLLHNSQCHTS